MTDKPIWERLQEISDSVPPEVWEQFERERMQGKWQQIETAPMDGSWVLVAVPKAVGPGHYVVAADFYGGRWRSMFIDEAREISPTHWMPLPEPPITRD